jgi:regulator of sigma E protease
MLNFIVFLSVLIFVHELGHFLVAKACGVKVLKFSIGFGPKLIGFTRGETEYQIALLPFGGYVKMAGEQPYDEVAPEEAERGFLTQPAWKRVLISAAGPVFNLAFPVLVFFVVFMGPQKVWSTRVANVEPGMPAAEAGMQPGDRIIAIDGNRVRAFTEIRRELQSRFHQPVPITIERDGKQQVLTVSPVRNLDVSPIETVPQGMIGIGPVALPAEVGVPAGSPAEAAGLKTFDRLLAIDGKPVKDETELKPALSGKSGTVEVKVARFDEVPLPGVVARAPRVVAVNVPVQPGEGYAALGVERVDLYVRGVEPGSPVDKAGVKRGDRIVAIDGKPLPSALLLSIALNEHGDKPFKLTWRSGGEEKSAQLAQARVEVKDEFNSGQTELTTGLWPHRYTGAEQTEPESVTLQYTVGEAMAESLKVVPDVIRQTALGIAKLFTGGISAKSVGGPVMLYDLANRSAEAGFAPFLRMMAVISVNLGLMNLLPIPVLDGFHILSATWEGIRRRPISLRAREVANMVGLAMLLLLMGWALLNDILRRMAS